MGLAFLDMHWGFSLDSNDKLKHPSKPIFLTDFLVVSQSQGFLHTFCFFEPKCFGKSFGQWVSSNLNANLPLMVTRL